MQILTTFFVVQSGDNPISSDVTNEAFYQRASDFNQTGTVVVFTSRKDKGMSQS